MNGAARGLRATTHNATDPPSCQVRGVPGSDVESAFSLWCESLRRENEAGVLRARWRPSEPSTRPAKRRPGSDCFRDPRARGGAGPVVT